MQHVYIKKILSDISLGIILKRKHVIVSAFTGYNVMKTSGCCCFLRKFEKTSRISLRGGLDLYQYGTIEIRCLYVTQSAAKTINSFRLLSRLVFWRYSDVIYSNVIKPTRICNAETRVFLKTKNILSQPTSRSGHAYSIGRLKEVCKFF